MIEELRIEVNSACNYSCIHCYTDKNRLEHVSPDRLDEIISELARSGGTDLSLTGGEPLLAWQRVVRLASKAKNHGLRVRLNTNGHLLTPGMMVRLAGLIDEYQISLNAATEDRFARFVNQVGAFSKVVAGIRRAAESGAAVTIRFSLMAETLKDLIPTFLLADKLGVRGFKVRRTLDASPTIPDTLLDLAEVEEVLRQMAAHANRSMVSLQVASGDLGIDIDQMEGCDKLSCKCGSSAVFVAADGSVSACPFLREIPAFNVGNVASLSLAEVWVSPGLQAFRRQRIDSHSSEKSDGCHAVGLLAQHDGVAAKPAYKETESVRLARC